MSIIRLATTAPATTNWHTYQNKEYSFKYPPYWVLVEGRLGSPNNSIAFNIHGPNPYKDSLSIAVSVDIINVDDDRTPAQVFADIIARDNSSNLRYEYLSIGGHPALKTTGLTCHLNNIVLLSVRLWA